MYVTASLCVHFHSTGDFDEKADLLKVHTYMCVCTYVYMLLLYIHILLSVCLYIVTCCKYTYVCMYVHLYICVHVRMYI